MISKLLVSALKSCSQSISLQRGKRIHAYVIETCHHTPTQTLLWISTQNAAPLRTRFMSSLTFQAEMLYLGMPSSQDP